MAAGLSAMRKYDRDEVARLNRLGVRAAEGIRAALRASKIPGCVTGDGSFFRLHFKPQPPSNRRGP